MYDNHDFCRALLKTVRSDITYEQRKRLKGSWSYFYKGQDQGEFHVPNEDFYWFGSAHCAYDARQKGISAFLAQAYPDSDWAR